MRGRVAVPFLLGSLFVLLFSGALAADCSWTPQYSAELRTTALDLALEDGFLWVATGYGVQLVQNGTVVDTLPIPGNTRVVRTSGNGLAYVGSGSRVFVVRREGNTLSLVRSVAARAPITDIEISGYLFVATTSGIDHFDLIDPSSPFRTSVSLATSSPNVTSLAIGRNTLYAADGDTTVETFAIAVPSLPQNTGSLESVMRASYVHFANDQLFVSDAFGQTTDVFSGTARIARLPFGAASLAPAGGETYFVAAPDRTLRAVDLTSLTRMVERFEYPLAATDGTDNAIHALLRSGNTLYVAAGDGGVVTFDVTSLARPYTLAAYSGPSTTGVRASGDKAWFSDSAGNLYETRIGAAGVELTELRTWPGGAGTVVRDVKENGILTTSGSTATLWALVSSTPTVAATYTFPDTILDAVVTDTNVVALLASGNVWYTPSGQNAARKLDFPNILHLARSGSAVAFTEERESERRTILHYFADGFSALPRQFSIAGSPIGGIALDATRAAVFTFSGISVIELASGNLRVIADSQLVIPRDLAFAGDDLLVLDPARLLVYDDARTLAQNHPLPARATAFDATSNVAVLATEDGTGAALFRNGTPVHSAPFTNDFPTKLAASAQHVYLFDRDGIDIYSTAGRAPKFIATARAAGTIDLAATASSLYTLASNGTVTAWSPAGTVLASATISEGTDSQPLAITAAGNAVWVSISSGCTSGNCQRKTFVLDPRTLGVTATLTGTVRDVVVSGTRAYALFDVPNEIRVLDIVDPLHPAQVVAAARPATATSVAFDSGTVHVLGDKLYSFSENTLTPTGERFTAMTPDPAQQIRIAGGCAIVTGRSESPQLFSVPSWNAAAVQHEVPSFVRRVVARDGRLFLLTGHSLEIWSTTAPANAPRRRSVR